MMMHALIRGGIPAIYDIGKSDARLLQKRRQPLQTQNIIILGAKHELFL